MRTAANPIVAAFALAALLSAGAESQQVAEYEVKAAFLFNFAKFVEWPAQTFKTPSDPIVICVMGQNPFGNALAGAIQGKAVEGRALSVRQVADDEPAANCQILFVTSSQKRRFQSMLSSIRSAGILTVGDTQGFANDGGIVNFKLDGARVRFEINLEAAEQAHLRISSKLLSVAQIIRR